MVAVDLSCRRDAAVVIEHAVTPEVEGVDGIALHVVALVELLQHRLQILASLVIAGNGIRIAAPRCSSLHLSKPNRTSRVVIDSLALTGHEVSIAGGIAAANVPVGMSDGEVTARLIVVLVDIFEILRQIAEVSGLRRADASATSLEILIDAIGSPFVDSAAARALVAGVLLRVLRLVERERCRGRLAVHLAGTGPVAVLAARHVLHVRV